MKNPSNKGPVVPRGLTADRQTDRRTYMTKLIFTFRKFATAPKIGLFIGPKIFILHLLVPSLQSLALNHMPYIYIFQNVPTILQ